ncbi:MAG: PepSY domain-containing protein [Gemmatimonadetes bacterium]|nr:PepSY domain-containing protein [Gemmatimonadota bacterium]
MKKLLGAAIVTLGMAATAAGAQEPVRHAVNEAGHATAHAGKTVAKGTRHAANEAGHATAHAAKTTAKTTRHVANEAGHATAHAAKTTAAGARHAGNEVGHTTAHAAKVVTGQPTGRETQAMWSRAQVSQATALSTAQAQARGGTLYEQNREARNGQPVYEFKFRMGTSAKQKVVVDAVTGRVLESSRS